MAGKLSLELNTEFIGRNILYAENIDSTNLWAKENNFLPDGTVFVAETQNNGRGRRGNKWVSDGNGLWFSVLLKPDISPEFVSVITLVAGLSVCSVIGDIAWIKWPNDIIISSKKVCGILTEMSFGDVNYIVCGIGINLNSVQFDDSIKGIATSLKVETGKTYNKTEFLAEVLESFEKYYKVFVEQGFSVLSKEYKKRCITLNKTVRVTDAKESYVAEAVDITENGELVCMVEGKKKIIYSGDVSVRGLLGYSM